MSLPGESIDALLKARKHYIDNPEALMPEFLDVVNQNILAGSTERNLWMCHVDKLTEAIKKNKELPEIQGRNHSTKRPVDDDLISLGETGKKATEKETELFNNRLGLLQLKLVTVCGVAPHVFDTDVWKELATLSNPRWSPYTGDQIQVAIKLEAELCRQKTVEAVRKVKLFTKENIHMTVHVSTPDCEEYFLHAHKGDKAHHTAPWSIELIGPDTVAATCSDSTSVTKLAKELLVYAVHHLHNTIGDIMKLEYFTPTMKLLKSTVTHFSKSNLSVASLKEQASLNGDDYRVIQKSGNTCFGSNWTMAMQCLCVQAKDIELKSVQAMFKHELNGKLAMFKLTLGHYEAIVAPFICSLWSLEAPKANASDVYVFWLLSTAAVTDLFKKSSDITGIPRQLKEQVNGIFNAHFVEFFSNDLYFTAFILDNRYDEAEFFVDAAKIGIIPCRSEQQHFLAHRYETFLHSAMFVTSYFVY
ncbi:hypothetical protein EV368DRAFT_66772 [Lentinula lateritia]|nr:hypothetical protein EV368DRAFT_66772 [Lentinula lateritia]